MDIPSKSSFLIIASVLFFISPQALGITVDVSSSNGGHSTGLSTNYETTINDFVNHVISLTPQDGGISNHQHGTGGFTKSVSSKDAVTGNIALSYAKVVASDPGRPTTEYWSELSATPDIGLTEEWLTIENAKSISAFSKAYSPDGNNLAQSSVSINPSITSPSALANLDYWSRAYIDSDGLHSEQQAYSGRSGIDDIDIANLPSSLANGASGDRVIFIETAYNANGHFAKSQLDAVSADITHYEGTTESDSSKVKIYSGSQTSSTASINAYSQAFNNYIRTTTPPSYGSSAKSSASLTGLSKLDYGTNAYSDGEWIYTSQNTYPGAGNIDNPYDNGAIGGSITFTDTADSRDPGNAEQYASSSLIAKTNAVVPYYNGNVLTNGPGSIAYVSTLTPYVTADTSITYQTLAKNASGNYAKASAIASGAGSSLTLDADQEISSTGTALSSLIGMLASLENISVSGKTINVLSDETSEQNRYYLLSYASGIDTSGNPAHYIGSASSIVEVGSTQNIDSLSGSNAYFQDYRKKGSDIGYATLYPSTKSLAGSAVVSDTRGPIQGCVDMAASSGDIIKLSSGIFKENVAIDKSLKIYGAGFGKTIVGGIGSGSVFELGTIIPNIDVTLSGMSITKGSAIQYFNGVNLVSYGGGIYNKGRLTIDLCNITSNFAILGSGISNAVGGIALIKRSNIFGNTAGRSDAWGVGGGIENEGIIALTASNIYDNTAIFGWGGGIANYGVATVIDSNIQNNSAANGFGGGIANSGTSKLISSIVSRNTASVGGAMYNSMGKVAVTSSNIDHNRATWGDGGGIFNSDTIIVTGSKIYENYATSSGGGIYNYNIATITGSDIAGNNAGSGGGIANAGTATITSCNIHGNTGPSSWNGGGGLINWGTAKIKSSNIYENSGGEYGGGIFSQGTTTVSDSNLYRNSAYKGGGIAIYSGSTTITGSDIYENGAHWGGGIAILDGSIATLLNSDIRGNVVDSDGAGSGIFNMGTAKIEGCNIYENTMSSGSLNAAGGGIFNGGTANIRNSTISGNNVGWGGGIYNSGKLFIAGTSQIINNQARVDRGYGGYGGGVYSSGGIITFDGTQVAIENNNAYYPDTESSWYQGWGVYLASGTPVLKNGFNPETQVIGNTRI